MGRQLIVEADGGSRGNPGPAAYGTVVRDAATGDVLYEEGAEIGVDTNNVAEYRGLIAGLMAAKAIDPHPRVEARLDSKLIVEQMSGRWKIKHENMRRLALEAKDVLPSSAVQYKWVPRSANTAADRLVNMALDGNPVRRFAENPAGDDDDAEPEPAPNVLVGWSATHPVMTTTVLLRHGLTKHTAAKRFSGWGGDDPELSDAGLVQAQQVATHLTTHDAIDHVISSPMVRTRQTAEVVAGALGLAVELDDDLRECAFGDWDGLTFADVQEAFPDVLEKWLASTGVSPTGGESFDEVAERVASVRKKILADHPDRTVLLVTHVTPVKTLVRQAIEAPSRALFRMHVNPASLSSVQWFGDGHASVTSFNETSHLAG